MGYEHPADAHRVCKCRRVQIGAVQVLQSHQHGAAHYGGLIVCGSAWACPVCAAKIAERRRAEIAQAFDYAYNRLGGKKVVMVTLTFPHTAWQQLGPMLKQQSTALQKLRAGEPWRRVKDRVGYVGLIRSLEITHGANGWHPHTHECWIVDRDTDAAALRDTITRRWSASCRRAGILEPESEPDFERHAVHVMDWASDSDYLQKQDQSRNWGADREIASGSTKRSAGRSPFALLDDASQGDKQAAMLFRDYVLATKGRAQVYWSRGLKAAVGVDDKTDEQLAEEQQDTADVLALMTTSHWRVVLSEDARATILDLAEDGGWHALATWFDQRGLPPPVVPDG